MNRSFVEEEDKKCSKSTGKLTNLFSNSIQFSSVAQSYPTLGDPMDCSMTGLPVHHQLPEFTQTLEIKYRETKKRDKSLLKY